METRELNQNIRETLKGVGDACEALSGFIQQAANHLRAGEIREGNELLARVLEDFSQITSFLRDVGDCGTFKAEVPAKPFDELERESRQMVDLLNMAVEAQENRDWVFLADILEYEFSQKLGSWNGLMDGLSESCPDT